MRNRLASALVSAMVAQEYAASRSEVLPAEARAALEACGPTDAGDGSFSQISGHMKRKVYADARRTPDKRARADVTDNAAVAAGNGTVT